MENEITRSSFDDVVRLIEEALAIENVVPVAGIRCAICGQRADLGDLHEFAKGATPLPDPFPLGARVVRIGLWKGWAGPVVENRVISLSGEKHKHQRLVTVEPNDGSGRSFCQIEEGYDGCSDHLVLESEWEAQQQSGEVTQED